MQDLKFTTNVNVPLELIREYIGSKERKELLGVGIFFKMMRSNGVIWKVSYRSLMEWLRIGKVKAKRLLEQMKADKLFVVNGSTVSVRSFRDKTRKKSRKGRNYSGAVCALFKAGRSYTLKDIYNNINVIMLLARIKATAGETTLSNCNDSVLPHAYLTCRSMADTIKMGRSSVQRITKRLNDNGVIIKQPAITFAVIGLEHEKEIRQVLYQLHYKHYSFRRGACAHIVIPNCYSINDIDALRSVRHKIYGYRSSKYGGEVPKGKVKSTIPQMNGY